MLPAALLESSTSIVYSVKSLSGGIKLYWSRYLSYSFPDVTQAQKRQKEILLASRPLLDKQDADAEFNRLKDDHKIWVLASLQLLIDFSADSEDWISNRELKLLKERLGSPDERSTVEEVYAEIKKHFHEFENRKVFFISGSIRLLFIDFLLRWIALFVCNGAGASTNTLLLVNFLGIPPLVLLLAFIRSRSDRKHNQMVVEKAGVVNLFRVKFVYTGLQYSIAGFYLITGLLTAFLIIDYGPGNAGAAACLILYYLFLFNLLPTGRLTEYDLLQQIHSKENLSTLDADSNDEEIISIETQINASTGRLEAYVLESALFGALAFSGFLQIIATDLITFSDLEKFASDCFHVSQSLVTAKWIDFNKYAHLLNTEVSLFCLVSIETLVCSALFLAVIAARLRFSDVADKVRISLNLAKAYNEKEEQILLAGPNSQNQARLITINEKIYHYITEARLHLGGVAPIVSYMVYFRNAGLASFLAVLVSSSLFVSGFLGWCFIAMGVITVIYFNLKLISSSLLSFGFYFQIFFAQYSRMLLVSAVLPTALAFFISLVLHWGHTEFLLSLSFLFTGIYIFVWFVLMPHPDDKFGDIENLTNEAWRSSGWRLIKTVYGVLILLSFVGFAFRTSDVAGGSAILLIAFSGLSLGSYFIGFYLTRPRLLGFLVAAAFGTSCMGTLFKILHLAGGNEMSRIAFTLMLIFIAAFFVRRKAFHFILLRIAVVFFVLVFMYTPLFFKTPMRIIQIVYQHRTLSIAPIVALGIRIQQDFTDSEPVHQPEFDESIKACNEYIARYGDSLGRTEIHIQANGRYEQIAYEILDAHDPGKSNADTVSLNIALRAADQVNKINSVFHRQWTYWPDIELETDALIALGQTEKAKKYLNEAIAGSTDDQVVELAKVKLKAMNSE